MKELGQRYENLDIGIKSVYIVELSAVEYAELEKLLEERDLPAETKEKREWAVQFNIRLRNLGMSSRTTNVLARREFQLRDEEAENLPSFDDWAKMVLDDYRARGLKGRYEGALSYARNFGIKSYLELVETLRSLVPVNA